MQRVICCYRRSRLLAIDSELCLRFTQMEMKFVHGQWVFRNQDKSFRNHGSRNADFTGKSSAFCG